MKGIVIRREFWLICVLFLLGLAMHFWGPVDSLDIKVYYSSDEAQVFFRKLNGSEVSAYLLNEILDLGFLTTYSILFIFLFLHFYRSVSVALVCAIIPGVFDLVETVTIILLLKGFITEPPAWLGVVTCLKYTTGTLIVLSVIYRWLSQRRFF